MLFNSLKYLIFFPIVTVIYYLLPHKYRWAFLLGASYFFYMCWVPGFIVLIMISTFVDYYCARWIGAADTTANKRRFLYLTLAFNMGILLFFKYFNFFMDSFAGLMTMFGADAVPPQLRVILPVGISFFTFQSLSYTIDVYRGKRKPERHIGRYALYVSFFPQLVSGPIERAGNILPQYDTVQTFDQARIASGLRLMLWGFFKKMVVADKLALIVDPIYNSPQSHSGPALTVATILFAFQIFCDFSGYTDIAIGSARVLGIRMMQNFNRPYHAANVVDFWRRWHISLSTWFRDYLYISLGGSRVSKNRRYFNLFAVFLVSGLWHGANWTFVAWGFLHGIYIVTSHSTENLRSQIAKTIRLATIPAPVRQATAIAVTFILVTFAWIFFRAASISDALYICTHMFTGWDGFFRGNFMAKVPLEMRYDLIIGLFGIFIMETVHIIQSMKSPGAILIRLPAAIRWIVYYAFVLSILFFGEMGSRTFIYFQF